MRTTLLRVVTTLAASMLTMTLAPVPASDAADPEPAPAASASDQFAACLASSKRGDIVLLLDESGSLQETDPDNVRVTAAKYLVNQWATVAAEADLHLSVSVMSFGDRTRTVLPFTRLDGGGTSSIQQAVDSFATRNTAEGTDYWMALDGARQALSQRDKGADRACRAVVWFTDGKLDPTPTYDSGTGQQSPKPYLGDQASTDRGAAFTRAREDLCRKAGVADQLRSTGAVTLAVGLSSKPADMELMRQIATGRLGQETCGGRTAPVPGEFHPANDIDGLLLAFDRLRSPGQDPATQERGICQGTLCSGAEEQHRFVLDGSISSVHLFATSGVAKPGLYVTAPGKEPFAIPWKSAEIMLPVGGRSAKLRVQVLSDRTAALDIARPADEPDWTGQWALVFVDPSKKSATGKSFSSLAITSDIKPAITVKGQSGSSTRIHAGEPATAELSLVDGTGKAVPADSLKGSVDLDVSLISTDGKATVVRQGLKAADLAQPLPVDLSKTREGEASLRADLTLTTADIIDPETRAQKVPGTTMAVQRTEARFTVITPVGFPQIENGVDYGKVTGPANATASLKVTGPGCVWFKTDTPDMTALPTGVGKTSFSSDAKDQGSCITVGKGETKEIPLRLTTEHAVNGDMSGTVVAYVAPDGELGRARPVAVPVRAELAKPVDIAVAIPVAIGVTLAGILLPLGLLYATKRRNSIIPPRALLHQEMDLDVTEHGVLRDGAPLAARPTDFREMTSLSGRRARDLTVGPLQFRTVLGWSPFGLGRLRVSGGGNPLVTPEGMADAKGRAYLPLALHNSWAAWPGTRPGTAHAVVMITPEASDATRAELMDGLGRAVREHLPLSARGGDHGWDDPHGGANPFADITDPDNTDLFGDLSAPGAPVPAPESSPTGDSGDVDFWGADTSSDPSSQDFWGAGEPTDPQNAARQDPKPPAGSWFA